MNRFLNDTFTWLTVCGLVFSAITRAAGSPPPVADRMGNTVGTDRVNLENRIEAGDTVPDRQESLRAVGNPNVEETFIGAIPQPGAIEYLIVYPVALKTNLLFLLVGGLNAGLEMPIGDRFSASAGFAYAYTRINNRFAVQTLQGGFEAKYWFNPNKRPLTGWNLGIYGLYSSRFDVQWQDGWQGDGFVSMGVAGGYSLPVGRSLNLEFAAAAGAFHTSEVRKYSRPQDGHLIWEETRRNVWRFLPAKWQVNLVWLIQSKKRAVER